MTKSDASFEQQLEDYRFALSKVSHEIRNPVTLLNSYLQLLEAELPELKQHELWDNIMEEMLFLRHLLDDLSCYNNTFHCQFTKTEMTPWLLKFTESAHLLFPNPEVAFQISIPDALPVFEIDSVKLTQALLNLIRNAFEAAEHFVSFEVFQKEAALEIHICNDGSSLSLEKADEVFKPFHTTKPNGTGLGLPIAKGIIEAHKGSVSILPPKTNSMSSTHLRIVLPLN